MEQILPPKSGQLTTNWALQMNRIGIKGYFWRTRIKDQDQDQDQGSGSRIRIKDQDQGSGSRIKDQGSGSRIHGSNDNVSLLFFPLKTGWGGLGPRICKQVWLLWRLSAQIGLSNFTDCANAHSTNFAKTPKYFIPVSILRVSKMALWRCLLNDIVIVIVIVIVFVFLWVRSCFLFKR